MTYSSLEASRTGPREWHHQAGPQS